MSIASSFAPVESTPEIKPRAVGVLRSEGAIALAGIADLDTRWRNAQASRGNWLLDITSTDHARLAPADLRDIVAGLLRPKHVEVLADGTVRAHTRADADTRAAEVMVIRSLATRELSSFVKFIKWTDHTPSCIVSDAVRDGSAALADVDGATFLALPAGSYAVRETVDNHGKITVTLTQT